MTCGTMPTTRPPPKRMSRLWRTSGGHVDGEDVVLQTDDVPQQTKKRSPRLQFRIRSTEGEPERGSPAVPEGGLPDGWTMDQWTWYGHQWLERSGRPIKTTARANPLVTWPVPHRSKGPSSSFTVL